MDMQKGSKKSAFALNTVGANVTFYQHIKPMFTQWDQVQMLYNVQVGSPFDLWDYVQVRDNAAAILYRLTIPPSGGEDSLYSGMPKYIGPWSEQDIALFQSWMDNGFLEGDPPATPEIPDYKELRLFVGLSEYLTGFDNLAPVMAQLRVPPEMNLPGIYLYRLITGIPGTATSDRANAVFEMLHGFDEISHLADFEHIFRQSFAEQFKELIEDILTLWYGTYLVDRNTMQPYYGTPDFNQYIYGLVWLNGGAHPQGHATYAENTKVNPPLTTHTNTNDDFYWHHPPSDPHPETGLFTKNTGY